MTLLRRLARDPLSAVALALAAAIILAAILAPWIAPGDPTENDLSLAMQPPGPGLLLGADDQGRDMVTRILYGLRLTLVIGAAAILLGGSVGATLGLLAGFYRRIDGVIMRAMDVMLSFPAILFGLAIAAIVGPGVLAVVLALAVATIPLTARVARASAAVEMGRDYMEAARAIGMNDRRLIWRHLAPNCASALVVFATLRFGQVILLGAALSFLGLGPQPPTAELGSMASQGRTFLFFAPHVAVIPCLAIVLVVLVFNILGDALRDALDPRITL